MSLIFFSVVEQLVSLNKILLLLPSSVSVIPSTDVPAEAH